MQQTAHFQARMNQRGIQKDLVDLALELGDVEGDRYVLTPKALDTEIQGARKRLKALERARSKGGVVVVACGDTLVTTYRANSFNYKLSNQDLD